MKISPNLRLSAAVCIWAFANAYPILAQDSGCSNIADQVTAAVAKEPGKVLMVVEDALVINENCACEIIRAAILASKADGATVNEIVKTAISTAPKMSAVIMDCATSTSPGALPSQVTAAAPSGKDAKNPQPAPAPETEDFNPVPSSIRGIYLMQPPAGGFIPRDPKPRKCDDPCVSPTHAHPYYP